MSTYITGTNQRLVGVHPPEACAGRNCAIHNPSAHSMVGFPTHWRQDRQIMERMCPHGVGHPDPDDISHHSIVWGEDISVHGCDGCCAES